MLYPLSYGRTRLRIPSIICEQVFIVKVTELRREALLIDAGKSKGSRLNYTGPRYQNFNRFRLWSTTSMVMMADIIMMLVPTSMISESRVFSKVRPSTIKMIKLIKNRPKQILHNIYTALL
jgi:hypothetical protein